MFLLLVLACHTSTPVATEGPIEVGPGPTVAPVEDIDVATLSSRIDAGQVPILVDVRTPGEFAEGHIPGLKGVDYLSELEEYRGGPVTLVCRSGGRSAKAAEQLAGLGFATVNVEGGTLAWIEAGKPVE